MKSQVSAVGGAIYVPLNRSHSTSHVSFTISATVLFPMRNENARARKELPVARYLKQIILFSENLKMKWRGIRDYYRKELKKLEKPRSGDGADSHSTSNWPLFPLLSFLNDSMSTRPRTTNLESTRSEDALEPAQETTENAGNDSITEFSPRAGPSQDITQNPKSTSTERNMQRQALKKKGADLYRQSMLELEAKKLKLLERDLTEDEDDDLLFFKSMLKDFKSLPRERRMLLKIKFQEMLYKEITGASVADGLSQQHYSTSPSTTRASTWSELTDTGMGDYQTQFSFINNSQ